MTNIIQSFGNNQSGETTDAFISQLAPTLLLLLLLLLIISFLLISNSPPLYVPPRYLSTRPWRLSPRSVAPSVALGRWMG